MLQLSLQTDYGLRVLMYLVGESERATIGEIAAFFSISKDHVAKVVQRLVKLRYVRSMRGIGGGIELLGSADEITIGQVIQDLEGGTHLLECVGADDVVCVIQPGCKLRTVLGRAQKVQQDYLNSVTLADVVPKRKRLYSLKVSAT